MDGGDYTTLYDSDRFMVVCFTYYATRSDYEPKRYAFEIVDKRAEQEVLLVGHAADAFAFQTKVWQADTPTEEAVDDKLDGFAQLGRLPLRTH